MRATVSQRGLNTADIFGDPKNSFAGFDWSKTADKLRKLSSEGKIEELHAEVSGLLSPQTRGVSPTQKKALMDLEGGYQTYERSVKRSGFYAEQAATAKMGGDDITKNLLSNQTFTDGISALNASAASTSNNTAEMVTTLNNISNSIANLRAAPVTNMTITTTSAKDLEFIIEKYKALADDVTTLKKNASPKDFPPKPPQTPNPDTPKPTPFPIVYGGY